MSAVDTRHLPRDSMFMLTQMRVAQDEEEYAVKVRNLSAGGMMVSNGPVVGRGTKVSVYLRNIGWVEGIVAWVHDSRFGIAFVYDIDPKQVRSKPLAERETTPRYLNEHQILSTTPPKDPASLRKI